MKVVTKYKSDIKYTEIVEGQYVAESKHWSCEIDERIPLAYHIEVLNMDDATGEPEYKQYPFVVSISIIAAKPSKKFYEGDGKADRYSTIYDCVSYMGGVPVDHKFLDTDKLNKNITEELKAKQAKLVTYKANFGTLAAQRGAGAEITYPQFKDHDVALAWAKELVSSYGDMLMTLVGFTLDQPINMAGDNGWSTIEHQVTGERK